MKLRWIRTVLVAGLAAAMLATSATPASAAAVVTAYASFDGLAPGPGCATQPSPYTVAQGGWEITSDTGTVTFCPGNVLPYQPPPDASHLQSPAGATTTLQQDVPTNTIYTNYYVSYSVAATVDSVTTQVTVDGTTTPCVSDTSSGPDTCDIPFTPTGSPTSITVTVPNALAVPVEFDTIYVWVPA